jgi:hypothetical protein
MCKFRTHFSFRVFGGRDHLICPSQKINVGRLVMLTKPFFYYLKFCSGGWFSVSRNSFSKLREKARNRTPAPPSGFGFVFLTSLECERVRSLQRDWVGGRMVGWWAFELCRTEGAWESRCFLRPEMEEIIEHHLGESSNNSSLSLPKPRQKNTIKSPINFAPSPSSRLQSPFLRNTLAEWGTGKNGGFSLKAPGRILFVQCIWRAHSTLN